jgi:flagellar assembly protein FliH
VKEEMMSSSLDPKAKWDPPLLGDPQEKTGEWLPTLAEGTTSKEGWDLPELMESDDPMEDERSQMEESLARAYERGKAEGFQEGSSQAEEKLNSAILALRNVADSISASRRQHLQELDANLCALALAVAKKIVLRDISTEPSVVGEWVRRAIELVGPDAPIDVRLNPKDLELLENQLAREPGEESIPDIRWVADQDLERGSFFVEGVHRIVDGRLDEALANLYGRIAHE